MPPARDGRGAVRLVPPRAPATGPRLTARVFRPLLLGLSGAGVAAAGVLLASGHAGLALRILAGDVLLIFGLLLLA